MKYTIEIPGELEKTLQDHLFQNELEQGAFLFASVTESRRRLSLEVVDIYLVPPEGWAVQMDLYLEMRDEERARIMKMARSKDLAVIDCHSHPTSGDNVWFSPSDKSGITEFAGYANWKLDGKPYIAMVWGESSVDAVIWHGNFDKACRVDEVRVVNGSTKVLIPKGTWFRKRKFFWLWKR